MKIIQALLRFGQQQSETVGMVVQILCATAALLGSSVTSSLSAEWDISSLRDPFNAEVVDSAILANADGYRLQLFRSGDGRVRWILSLPSNSFDRLTEAPRVAAVAIDSHAAVDIELGTYLDDTELVESSRAVRTILWHGEGNTPTRGTFRNLLDGQAISVRFYLEGGGYVDTAFEVPSDHSGIAEMLNIEVQGDPAAMAAQTEREDALSNGTIACLSAANTQQCIGFLLECTENIEQLSGAEIRACMAARGISLD